MLAKARTFLLTATLHPDVDWVLWLDSDVIQAPTSLISDLLVYGNAGVGYSPKTNDAMAPPLADVITPNIMREIGPHELQGYDLNKYAPTMRFLRPSDNLPFFVW